MKIIITEKQLETITNDNEGRMIPHIKRLIDMIDMEGVCDVKIYSENDESEDEMYSVYLVINPEWYAYNKERKNIIIKNTKKTINDKLKLYLNLNVFVGSYVNPDNC
jgi:hypothetical protein